jgi:tryptophan-rich sensory protein
MDWVLFLIFLATCLAAGSTGAIFQPGDWYKSLDKPRWTPPDWAFPLAWSILYLCIAAAAARAAPIEGSAYAMATFALQIALNTLWTPVFFGLRKMGGGMLVIVGLWVAVAATMVLFFQLDTIAGLLFVPYLGWVSIAAALNFSVWRRNASAPLASSG